MNLPVFIVLWQREDKIPSQNMLLDFSKVNITTMVIPAEIEWEIPVIIIDFIIDTKMLYICNNK